MKTSFKIFIAGLIFLAGCLSKKDANIKDDSTGMLVTKVLPKAYMNIVVNTDTLERVNKKQLEDAELKWCKEGHEGHQVIVVNRHGDVHLLDFNEIKHLAK